MRKKVAVLLVGIGGYGNIYVKKLLDENHDAYIVGAVDVNPKVCKDYDRLVEMDIPIFQTMDQFFAKHQADLTIISTPIHLHKSQTCLALANGSHVLCEKPISATLEDAQEMMLERDRSEKFLAIGFNWSFYPSVQQLKQDILDGLFGRPKRLKTIVLWPRNKAYFERSNWAGKKYSSAGDLILDSVANNATAHFLHHMFYLLGPSTEQSTSLKNVTAELYRANLIETFDTCALRMYTEDDVELLYYATHAVEKEEGPNYLFEFERATISYQSGEDIIATFHDGTKRVYENPQKDHFAKLPVLIERAKENSHDILCGAEASLTHAICISAMHRSVQNIPTFPAEIINVRDTDQLTWVSGLEYGLKQAYDNWSLPNELGMDWATSGETVSIKDIVKS
ncbi:Gfo/Idh/MocA family protein [Aquibacillus salsiterrae]|uniref:Gfo/Idh/MocA family oxidoreductase n=1 Tax=Aquibacillus salsiterrae TaxID=2950439 RepID=A0A9X4ADX6_9BACI|nr:Gfo/Idh/MocA family oxidoreductase [Aquibacillus salsiterrae]MDC3416077.1 Gfo/Idh/MocA family oxidoreductase [Aquibacillus salsiterrae]